MAKQRTSVQKRRKETSRMEKRLQKKFRREQRKEELGDQEEVDPSMDPDLVGIVPGPQVIPDYSYKQ